MKNNNQLIKISAFPILFLSLFTVINYYCILKFNHGYFTYTADDVYIHLELAKQIFNGTYGLHSGVFSAPASSILWPFLLVPFVKTTWFTYVPLVLNFILSIGIIFAFSSILKRIFANLDQQYQLRFPALLIILLLLCTNVLPLIFIGMEHSAQILLASLIFLGLLQLVEAHKAPTWIYLILIIAPLIRYELLAITMPALLLIFFMQHKKAAIITFILSVGVLLGFSLFLWMNGNQLLPNSIMAKMSIVIPRPDLLSLILIKIQKSISLFQVKSFIIATVVLLYALYKNPLKREESWFVWTAILAMGLYFLFGPYSKSFRYTSFIATYSYLMIFFAFRQQIIDLIKTKSYALTVIVLSALLFLYTFPVLIYNLAVPTAANNMYLQQRQMSRFVHDFYQKPVAANDIGMLSYQNKNEILDIAGLDNAQALKYRLSQDNSYWLNTLVQEKNIKLIMLYQPWFPKLPKNWQLVATLTIPKPIVYVALPTVYFYAVDKQSAKAIIPELLRFSLTLPEGELLKINRKLLWNK